MNQEERDEIRTMFYGAVGPLQTQVNGVCTGLERLTGEVVGLRGEINGVDCRDGLKQRLSRVEGLITANPDTTQERKHYQEQLEEAREMVRRDAKLAKLLAATDSVPPNRVQVAREKTKQERLRLGKRIATVAGLVLLGATGGAGLLQLLSPAQASQPAAAQAP